MADFTFGQAVQPVADNVTDAVQVMGSHQEYITITTNIDIRSLADSGGTAASQANLNKLIQVVSERGQPVIIGAVTATTSPFSIYMLNEHYNAWGAVDLAVPQALGTALAAKIAADGINYGFGGAVFNGTIATYTLTVNSITSGQIAIGSLIAGSSVTAGSYVTAFLTGTGGVGTYTLAASSTVGPEAMTAAAGITVTQAAVLT